ncbi:unnamed protein product [Brachionus calyciflorus]|uniref:Uncharacterized protein n=1 Tax=Brachionus calyciflorus TaxID=104777 RepID=A0A813YRR7_9BILA|nr:unnamed protein product [Brachionus calyciflorus]
MFSKNFELSNESETSEEEKIIKNKLTNGDKQKKYRKKRKLELLQVYEKKNNLLKLNQNVEEKIDCTPPANDMCSLISSHIVKESFESVRLFGSFENNVDYDVTEDTSSESSFSLDESECDDNHDQNMGIYSNCKIKCSEFIYLFEALVDKLAIPETKRIVIYEFIQLILPNDSNIPSSYYRLKKNLVLNEVESINLCKFCKSKIKLKENTKHKTVRVCSNELCHSKKDINLRSQNIIKIYNSNFLNQIYTILDNYYENILSYKSKMFMEKNWTDIMSGKSYVFEENTINLILFTDGVTYNKSGINSMWAILSAIVELPPVLRGSYENLIFHSSWTGSQPDFNLWLSDYSKQIEEVLRLGFEWKNKKFKLKIHAFIADSPARSKCCNSIQFNGYFGCIKCMHPRTNNDYNLQVKKAENENIVFEGIKGFSYLSNWISIPEDILFDYMHLSLVGTFKKIFNNFFDKSNWQEKYYLNKNKLFIDKRLLSVSLPKEIKRKCRSLDERHFYKANEFRTIAFYLSFGLFKDILPNEYLNNLMKYIIFLRILCQDKISQEDLEDSQKIIIDFIKEFETLYGRSQMTSNLHGHLHLPRQVKDFGPLNKSSCFPFENVFKTTRDLFHGTKNFEGQIALNFERRKSIKRNIKLLNNGTTNLDIKNYVRSYFVNYNEKINSKLIKPY